MRTHLTLALIAFLAVLQVSAWNPSRVRYIDTAVSGNNWLFRGPEAIVNGQFIYDELHTTIQTVAQRDMNITLPANFRIIDFNLLLLEVSDTNIEKEFFKKNPNLGSFYHYAIVGDLLAPGTVSSSIRKTMANTLTKWQIDNLPKAMDTLQQLLNGQYDAPTVVYIHCEAGMDRTGEVSGSYYMRYLNWPFQYALSYDNTCIEGRNISTTSRNSFQWYCYYLQINQGRNQNCDIPNAYVPVNCATGIRGNKFQKW